MGRVVRRGQANASKLVSQITLGIQRGYEKVARGGECQPGGQWIPKISIF